ncbi:glycogen phosphorylase, brain form-like [Argonauta hians]
MLAKGVSDAAAIEHIKKAINRHLHYTCGVDRHAATKRDYYKALATSLKDELIGRWRKTQQFSRTFDAKKVYYLSMEFDMGKFLENAMLCIGNLYMHEEALRIMNIKLNNLIQQEDPLSLGNSGPAILAANFLDSMATVGICGYGCGIRYKFGTFTQYVQDGDQSEIPYNWLANGNPWERAVAEDQITIRFAGRVEVINGLFHWIDTENLLAIPYDYPVPGYKNNRVNTLRLWSARSIIHHERAQYENDEDYVNSMLGNGDDGGISNALYPSDSYIEGDELRLKQEYFLIAASLQDIVRSFKSEKERVGKKVLTKLPEKVAIHLNDSRLGLAIPELMRILVDEEGLGWDDAWEISYNVFCYNSQSILPEVVEEWPVHVLENLLPRHLQLIYHINHLHLEKASTIWPDDNERRRKLSIFIEVPNKRINMAHLCIVGSHSVISNSRLHSDLLKHQVYVDFHEMMPQKFQNITCGISPRRWIVQCNPCLTDLISGRIGESWITNLSDIKELLKFESDGHILKDLLEVKTEHKKRLADYIKDKYNVFVSTTSLFDIQVKRIHEHKRQLLNCLHIITKYCRIKYDKKCITSRTVIIAGKASPKYAMAKLIIKFICRVAKVINNDAEIGDKLKVIYLPDYRLSLAEKIIPAADLSQHISLAGTEACGIANMKFMANGALSIYSMDGTNMEILREVGEHDIFTFGHTADRVKSLRESGYSPSHHYHTNEELKKAMDLIRDGHFSGGDTEEFMQIFDYLYHDDYFMILADYDDYVQTQTEIEKEYNNPIEWFRKCLRNISLCGKFSSDRAVTEYADKIWHAEILDSKFYE